MLITGGESAKFGRVGLKGYFRCRIQKLLLAPGSYSVNLILRQNDIIQDWLKESAAVITVIFLAMESPGRTTGRKPRALCASSAVRSPTFSPPAMPHCRTASLRGGSFAFTYAIPPRDQVEISLLVAPNACGTLIDHRQLELGPLS